MRFRSCRSASFSDTKSVSPPDKTSLKKLLSISKPALIFSHFLLSASLRAITNTSHEHGSRPRLFSGHEHVSRALLLAPSSCSCALPLAPRASCSAAHDNLFSKLSTIRQQSLPNQATLISKRKTYLCYCIFESCNGAQEVEGQATDSTGGMDFGSGLTANLSPF